MHEQRREIGQRERREEEEGIHAANCAATAAGGSPSLCSPSSSSPHRHPCCAVVLAAPSSSPLSRSLSPPFAPLSPFEKLPWPLPSSSQVREEKVAGERERCCAAFFTAQPPPRLAVAGVATAASHRRGKAWPTLLPSGPDLPRMLGIQIMT
ncbi:uncharacterized protein LOC130948137 isoform X2 [Arachis stenosperma]|uniref:uncharacterized protein LOC130948137 isoform X2 n=1 Tax=Arachis stenosperma TaxID=217475 RepID=UPI0025ACE89C|nr:uncharacterized protein LOC130948137 isoform X2 [Arachis stenosperma]